MPNGGSDCCGTCRFNNYIFKDKGHPELEKDMSAYCIIRKIQIPDPLYTYCANHPQHNKERIEIPLGPVYVHSHYGSREIWLDPPDTEDVRLELLYYLENIDNGLAKIYPLAKDIEEIVITQLTELKEKRAIPGLLDIIKLDIEIYRNFKNMWLRNKVVTVGHAIESLLILSDGELIEEVKHFINSGIENGVPIIYEVEDDNFAILRYHLVRGLQYVNSNTAIRLLEIALNDPHSEVKAFAKEILKNKLKQKKQS